MIGILAHWEPQEENFRSGRPVDVDVWKETVIPLGVDLFILIDKDNLNPPFSRRQIQFENYGTIEEALDAHPEMTKVFMMPQRTIPDSEGYTMLEDYDHPAYALYVLGPDSGTLTRHVNLADDIVSIKTQHNYAMWSMVVAGIVVWDRKVKGY